MKNPFIETALKVFRQYQDLGTKTIERLDDDQLHWEPSPGANSVAVNIQHLAGNMRSRFTDFLTTDGEKPNRHRDTEFDEHADLTKEALLTMWHNGWNILFNALEGISDNDLQREVSIRGERYTVLGAIQRQIAHYAYHVGQIVYLGKVLLGDKWESLSIPRGESDTFNNAMKERFKP
jgi:hypothetical protein